jgi:hypothetical protein
VTKVNSSSKLFHALLCAFLLVAGADALAREREPLRHSVVRQAERQDARQQAIRRNEPAGRPELPARTEPAQGSNAASEAQRAQRSNKLTAEERKTLRRQIDDAGRDLYRNPLNSR